VKRLPARILGSAVGSIILLTNANTFAAAIGVSGAAVAAGYMVLAVIALVSVSSALLIHRRERAVEAALAAEPGIPLV
jgi:uncharacterized protein